MRYSMREVEIITATAIYLTEQDSTKLWTIVEQYTEFRNLMESNEDIIIRIQAWQYVKAYIRLLKDRKHWDQKNKRPMNIPLFMNINPESDNWVDYYIRHPKEQSDMNEFNKVYQQRKNYKGGNHA